MVLVNDGDLAYARVALDSRSFAALQRHGISMDDGLARAVVWGVGMPAMLALGYSGWRARADPGNLTAGLGGGADNNLAKVLKSTADFLKEQKKITQVLPSYTAFVDPSFLQTAIASN